MGAADLVCDAVVVYVRGMLNPAPAPSPFSDITPMLDHLPPTPKAVSADDVRDKLDTQNVKAGPLLPLLVQLQRWKNGASLLNHPRICLFASHYAVPDDAAATTQNTITALQNDHHPLKQVAASLNADLRIYELDLAQTKRTAQQAAQAMTYGMLSIDDKSDAIVIASLSEGAQKAAKAIQNLGDREPDDLLQELVTEAGLDFFAALGAALAARLAGQVVITGGAFGEALNHILEQLSPQATEHVVLSVSDVVTQDMAPVFAAVQNLQQARFLLSFLPTQHVRIV